MVFVCGENEKNVYGKRQFEAFVRLVSNDMRAELCCVVRGNDDDVGDGRCDTWDSNVPLISFLRLHGLVSFHKYAFISSPSAVDFIMGFY